eukprot:gnl/TRDRNA2_/TRDRNA2_70072_c0_seq2.p1 gnl/TRDRNA2_/TRDRNA2_70072_c0~~gnl/TRDRNA2_/TRDRNA2_70072_c0_seq2.p1  ORF type:complete len:297 (+),score=29.74 gnl/TRDRNA2_/TRDRNA2_70072_c0_seq2:27-917(+)
MESECRRRCTDGWAAKYHCISSTRTARWRRHSANGPCQPSSIPGGGLTDGVSESSCDSARRAYTEGSQLLKSGRVHDGISLLLRAQRLAVTGPCNEESQSIFSNARESVAAMYRSNLDSPAFVPLASKRQGSLLLGDPPGPGQRHHPEYATGMPPDADGYKCVSKHSREHFEPWLCGGEVPRVDCATEEGFQRARAFVSRNVPVVMLNLGLMPATAKWSVDYLSEHTTEWPGMTVLKSSGVENRYLYYVPEQPDRDMSSFRGAPRLASMDLNMSFSNFLRASREDPGSRYYLQAVT